MKNKKAVSAFWWILIFILGVVVFMGLYVLLTGTYVNDFWKYNNREDNSVIEAGQGLSSEDSDGSENAQNNNPSGSDMIATANRDMWSHSLFNNTNFSYNKVDLSSLPPPPVLP